MLALWVVLFMAAGCNPPNGDFALGVLGGDRNHFADVGNLVPVFFLARTRIESILIIYIFV
ncbi:MAG TPA: hypothetical protein DHV83_06680 [Prevotella sp.]|jgi:hypothetical protein|nr:hypothetical protein [Prevotella sp.]